LDYLSIKNMVIEKGSFFNENQIQSMAKVAVLGSTVTQDLFGDAEPIGKTIRINKINFKVIGVFEAKGGSTFTSSDDTIFVPLLTMQKILIGTNYLSNIVVNVQNKDLMSQVKDEITFALASKHQVDPNLRIFLLFLRQIF